MNLLFVLYIEKFSINEMNNKDIFDVENQNKFNGIVWFASREVFQWKQIIDEIY